MTAISAHGDRRPVTAGSFYHLDEVDMDTRACQGTACFVARQRDPDRWLSAEATEPRVYCLGRCHAGPARADEVTQPSVAIVSDKAVVLRRCVTGATTDLAGYSADGGYEGLRRALSAGADAVVAEVDAAALRGRGGAGYPTARKWLVARGHRDRPRVFVVNADEGDPGAYIDRILLERDPHAVLEGLAIAAFAIGAERAYIYVRREYPDALTAIQEALTEAERAGYLGDALLGHGPALRVSVVEGKGSYVCGEETALLNALERRRPMVRARPPFPADHGLFGLPTVVNNVETLVNIPWILRHGGEAYAAMGFGASRGTKAVSLNSLFVRPGLYEVDFGTPLRTIVEEIGGGLQRELHGVIVGGPLAAALPPGRLDVPLAFESLGEAGASLGHGGIIAFDDTTSAADLIRHVFRFGAYESCGACTPCRIGAAHIAAAFSAPLRKSEQSDLESTIRLLGIASLCGHGRGLAEFANSMLMHYGEELEQCQT